jgi:hypothetical protein
VCPVVWMEYIWTTVRLGDSRFPKAQLAGGPQMTSSIGSAVAGAANDLRRRLVALAMTTPSSPLHDLQQADIDSAGCSTRSQRTVRYWGHDHGTRHGAIPRRPDLLPTARA